MILPTIHRRGAALYLDGDTPKAARSGVKPYRWCAEGVQREGHVEPDVRELVKQHRTDIIHELTTTGIRTPRAAVIAAAYTRIGLLLERHRPEADAALDAAEAAHRRGEIDDEQMWTAVHEWEHAYTLRLEGDCV